MYWIKSNYTVNTVQELWDLQKLYQNVSGELKVYSDKLRERKLLMTIEWQKSPYFAINSEEINFYFPLTIEGRFCGPQSIFNVSLRLKKMDPLNFEHSNKESIIEWSEYIDNIIKQEMERTNDIGGCLNAPKNNLHSMNELLMACQYSKLATHIFPGKNSVLVFNQKCVYLPAATISNSCVDPTIMFDKDDGFISNFGELGPECDYMKNKFEMWKNNSYKGDLQNYCTELKEYCENC